MARKLLMETSELATPTYGIVPILLEKIQIKKKKKKETMRDNAKEIKQLEEKPR